MDTLTYLRADTLAPERVVAAFNHAFEGYFVPMTHTIDTLRALIEVNDVSLAHSLIAVDEDGHPGGIVLLARRGARGWIAGMGLAPQWRGRGQADPLMLAALAEARALGLASVALEVLAQNTPARRLYTRLGFANVRPLAVFTGPLADNTPAVDVRAPIVELAVERALADFAALHQAPPPWQRELAALTHMAPSLRALALMDGETTTRQPHSHALWPRLQHHGLWLARRNTRCATRRHDCADSRAGGSDAGRASAGNQRATGRRPGRRARWRWAAPRPTRNGRCY